MRDDEAVPEADALEQSAAVDDEDGGDEPVPATPPRLGDEVPEADALEQAREVPLDDDEHE